MKAKYLLWTVVFSRNPWRRNIKKIPVDPQNSNIKYSLPCRRAVVSSMWAYMVV